MTFAEMVGTGIGLAFWVACVVLWWPREAVRNARKDGGE